jgi:hypothetical protein
VSSPERERPRTIRDEILRVLDGGGWMTARMIENRSVRGGLSSITDQLGRMRREGLTASEERVCPDCEHESTWHALTLDGAAFKEKEKLDG